MPLPPRPGLPAFPADPTTYLDPRDQPIYNDLVGNEESRTFDGVTLIVDHAFEWGHLTSTTAWREFDTRQPRRRGRHQPAATCTSTPPTARTNTSWYQEFKFSGGTERLDWVAGASYYQEKAKQTSEINAFSDTVNTHHHHPGPGAASGGSSVRDTLLAGAGRDCISLLGPRLARESYRTRWTQRPTRCSAT